MFWHFYRGGGPGIPNDPNNAPHYVKKLEHYSRMTYRHWNTAAKGYAVNREFSNAINLQRKALADLEKCDEKNRKKYTDPYEVRLSAYIQRRRY